MKIWAVQGKSKGLCWICLVIKLDWSVSWLLLPTTTFLCYGSRLVSYLHLTNTIIFLLSCRKTSFLSIHHHSAWKEDAAMAETLGRCRCVTIMCLQNRHSHSARAQSFEGSHKVVPCHSPSDSSIYLDPSAVLQVMAEIFDIEVWSSPPIKAAFLELPEVMATFQSHNQTPQLKSNL